MQDLTTLNLLLNKMGGRNLYLVGMMGSGKSQTGPKLAQALSYSFVDVDQVVEKAAKKTIQRIFTEDGEPAFREIETEVLKEIGKRHSLVVATGGGVVIKSVNWGVLHQGLVIWINPSREIILKRLKSDKNIRPLIQKNSLESFDLLFKEREPLYLESDIYIPITNETPEEVAFLILEKLEEKLNQNEDSSEPQTIG